MSKNEIREIQKFIREKKPAFLFGNGINRYSSTKNVESKSWETIIQILLEEKINDEQKLKAQFKEVFKSGFSASISYPEMYDLINMFMSSHCFRPKS